MATDPIVSASGLGQKAANTAQQKIGLAEDFQQFLTLLTTQLQNQDPLSPMDSTEFTNQLVQFSQVEQQINSNQKLDSMLALQLSSISSVALGYVGMDISYISSDMNYEGKPVDINFALSEEAVTSKVNIYNEEGTLVYTADAPRNTGTNKFTWNGIKTNGEPVADGTYTVKIDALNKDGKAIENSTVVTGHVRGIETQNGVVYVLVGDRAVAMSSIVNANSASQTATNNSAVALGYVGMDVTYKSSSLKFDGTNAASINYRLDEKAANTKIKVYDSAGQLVYTTTGATASGDSTFMWNGIKTNGQTASAGEYKIEIESTTSENEPVETTTFTTGRVNGVETRAGINYVVIGDRLVALSSIMGAKTPTTIV